jgi:predicted dienelactone hydrolase
MLLPDFVFLLGVLALAVWRLIAPAWQSRRGFAAGVVLVFATIQWILVGFTWQSVPAYVLLAVSCSPPIHTGAVARWVGRISFGALAAVCIGVWMLPAVPSLPKPDGRYSVGTAVFRWTDASREEPRTTDSSDRRSVIAQAWYPSDGSTNDTRIPYLDGTDRLPATVSGLPSFFMRRYHQINTHAQASPPLAQRSTPWPVVIFSPGYGAPRATYTGLATQLASRGFVVFMLDHPYESGVTQLPDGRVVGTIEHFTPGEPRTNYMAAQQHVRTADIRFVINQLARPDVLSPALQNINGANVAVIGHSFGGAVSAMVMSEDARVVAAANIDGTPYGDLPDRVLTRPFLLLQSDLAEGQHGALFHEGNGKLLANATAPTYRYELKRTNHYSFSDAILFVAPPARWLLSQLIGGQRGPAATQHATAEILAAFLSGPLTGVPLDLAATVARYP